MLSSSGGKTAHIASYLTSGKVTALDLYDHKVGLDPRKCGAFRCGRASANTKKKLDARKVHEFFGRDSFDKILVDAPVLGLTLTSQTRHQIQ